MGLLQGQNHFRVQNRNSAWHVSFADRKEGEFQVSSKVIASMQVEKTKWRILHVRPLSLLVRASMHHERAW